MPVIAINFNGENFVGIFVASRFRVAELGLPTTKCCSRVRRELSVTPPLLGARMSVVLFMN